MRFLTSRNTAFFSTCNDEYIPYSVASLLSVRKRLPKAKLFVISRRISDDNRKLLEQSNIQYYDLDLRGKFYRTWDYPVECYYIFAGPELLLEAGFKYSVYVDGDILCLSNPLKGIGKIIGVAGNAPGDCRGVFLNDYGLLKDSFNLSDEQLSRLRVTSCAVYFNNKKMRDISLLRTASELFKECLEKHVPRKGDDSLFTLIQLLRLNKKEVKNLGDCRIRVSSLSKCSNSANVAFYHFAENKPWKEACNGVDFQEQPLIEQWRSFYRGKLTDSSDKKIVNTPNDEAMSRERKLMQHGLILPLKRRQENAKKDPLNIFVCEDKAMGITNFGDEVQRDIIPAIFGYRIIPCSNPKDAELFSVGSVLFTIQDMDINKPVYVWGSGFISADDVPEEKERIPKINFVSVRGKSTLSRISKYTDIKSLPLGDPGILASVVYPKSREKNGKIGVVAHYIDADNPIVEKLRSDERFFVINPLDSPREVARQISSCKFILSSSLHGLIFADSYKIPNAHVEFSDKVFGGEYKFRDYDSGVHKHHLDADVSKIFDTVYLEKLMKNYVPIRNLENIQRDLIKAFPF